MLKLYKFKKGQWIFVDYGVKSKEAEYLAQGFIIIH